MSRRPWVRVYRRSDREVNRLVHALRGVFDGVWLGLLSPAGLAQLDDDYYDTTAQYTDEAYNRRGLWAWEQAIVDAHLPAGGRVSVTGAGGGREVLALLAQGFDAQGFEPNRQLAEFGAGLTAADGYGARVRVSGRDGFPVGGAGVDAVVIGWGAYMLLPSRRDRVELLRAAAAATGGGGAVVLSYFVLPVYRPRFRVAAAVAAPLRRLRRAEAPLLGDALSPTYAHHFTATQVAQEVRAAGLRVAAQGVTGAEVAGYGWTVARAGGSPK